MLNRLTDNAVVLHGGNTSSLFSPSDPATIRLPRDLVFDDKSANKSVSSSSKGRTGSSAKSESKLLPLDFYALESSAGIIVADRSPTGNPRYVCQCGLCAAAEHMPGCRHCGAVEFGVFRICGDQHGIFCKNCSAGVSRWDCRSCKGSNPFDKTIRLLVKSGGHKPKPQPVQEPTDSGSPVWNSLAVMFLVAVVVYHLMVQD